MIFCLDMDTFFVSVERIYQPELTGKPVVIGGDPANPRKGVVAAASYEIRKYGVHSGMPIYEAKQKCPEAIFVKPNFGRYQKYSKLVHQILRRYVPVLEQASIDEFYFDLTGCEKLYGNLFNFVTKLKTFINKQLKLPCSIGMGTNKHIAKVASKLAKPNRLMFIEKGSEQDFLAPYEIKYIQGIGAKTQDLLISRGIKTIGQLSAIPEKRIAHLLGKSGSHLLAKALGLGSVTFHSEDQRKSVSHEETFLIDTSDEIYLKKRAAMLLEKICFTLRKENLKAGVLTIKIRYADFTTKTIQQKIFPSNFENKIYPFAIKLFDKLYRKREKLRLLGVCLSDLQKETPLTLFSEKTNKEELYQAIDKIKSRFGTKLITWVH